MKTFFLFFLFLMGSLQGEILFQEAAPTEILEIQKAFYSLAAQQSFQAGKFANEEMALEDSKEQFIELTEDKDNSVFYYYIISPEGIKYGYAICCYFNEMRGCCLYGLYIEENYRGCGIGTQTMQYLETFLKERGVEDITLHVYAFNQTALGLYKKMGYETYFTNYNQAEVPQGYYMIKFLR